MVHASFLSISDWSLHDTKRTTLLGRCGPVAVASNTSFFFCLLMRLHNSNLDMYVTHAMYMKKIKNKKQWDNSSNKKKKIELTIFFRRHGSPFRPETANSTQVAQVIFIIVIYCFHGVIIFLTSGIHSLPTVKPAYTNIEFIEIVCMRTYIIIIII